MKPPLAKQSVRNRGRMAEILAHADRLRANRRRAEDRLDRFQRIYFLEHFGDPQSNARRWPQLAFGALGENQDALRSAGRGAGRSAPDRYPRYGMAGIVDWIEDAPFSGERLLVAADGMSLVTRLAPVARIASGRFAVNAHAHVIAANGLADLQYLRCALELIELKPYLASAARPRLERAELERIRIPVPPMELQRAFRALVEKAEAVKALQQTSLQKLDELYASLRHHGVRGRLIADR